MSFYRRLSSHDLQTTGLEHAACWGEISRDDNKLVEKYEKPEGNGKFRFSNSRGGNYGN